MTETVKEARIRAALEQVDRFGGVHEPLAEMLVSKIRRILGDVDNGGPLAADLWVQPEITSELLAEGSDIAARRRAEYLEWGDP